MSHQDLVAGLGLSSPSTRISRSTRTGATSCFLEMAGHRLGHALGLDELHETELDRFVTVLLVGLLLHDNAGPA